LKKLAGEGGELIAFREKKRKTIESEEDFNWILIKFITLLEVLKRQTELEN
jgi:hypothetical protein